MASEWRPRDMRFNAMMFMVSEDVPESGTPVMDLMTKFGLEATEQEKKRCIDCVNQFLETDGEQDDIDSLVAALTDDIQPRGL